MKRITPLSTGCSNRDCLVRDEEESLRPFSSYLCSRPATRNSCRPLAVVVSLMISQAFLEPYTEKQQSRTKCRPHFETSVGQTSPDTQSASFLDGHGALFLLVCSPRRCYGTIRPRFPGPPHGVNVGSEVAASLTAIVRHLQVLESELARLVENDTDPQVRAQAFADFLRRAAQAGGIRRGCSSEPNDPPDHECPRAGFVQAE